MHTTYHGIAWAGIYVEDLPDSTGLYERSIGPKPLPSSPRFVHFNAGSGALPDLFSGGTSSLDANMPADQSVVVALRVNGLAATQRFLETEGARLPITRDNSRVQLGPRLSFAKDA